MIIIKKGKFSQPRTHHQQDIELEQAFRQVTSAANAVGAGKNMNADAESAKSGAALTRRPQTNRKKIAIIATSIAVVLALLVGVGIWWFFETTADDGLIYSNVFAAGIDLGGMTEAEAKAAIQEATANTYSKMDLLVNFPDKQLILTPEDTGAALDIDRLVADAFAYGRSGSRWDNFIAKTEASMTSYTLDLSSHLTLDTVYIRQTIDRLASDADSTLTQTAVTVTGELPALDRTIDVAAADETVVHMTMTIQMGTPERKLDADSLYETVLNAYYTNDFTPITAEYHMIEPDAIDLQAYHTLHCVEPVDAVLNEDTYTVTPEVLGYGFDLEAVQAQLDAAGYGDELIIEFGFIAPEVTLMSLEQYLFKDELSSFASNHVNNSNRTRNLELACEAINGTIIQPGGVFSFNETVGQRTSDKGYKPASVYVSSETVSEVGGGICQVASTIYYCAMLADMEIVEREEHQFLVEYVPKGMDATIYWGSYDFKFRNNTSYPIRIDASTHDGKCHIAIYGTDDKDYYVEMTYELIGGPYYSEEQEVKFTKDNNPKGYSDGQVIQTAYTGYKYRTYRNKYSKSTDELISSEFEADSSFSSRPRKVAKLVEEEEEETKPSESTEPSTTAPSTEPPTTEPPTTEPPTTEPPVTEPPATEPPATEPPATEPPATEPPAEE